MSMTLLQRFFSSHPLLLTKVVKPPNVVNQVAPNLYQNLRDSTKQFIKGVINKDIDYIRQVSGKAIGQRFAQQLQQNKNVDFIKQYKLERCNFDSAQVFEICPYVVFGQDMKTRVQSPKLWASILPITSNRYLKKLPQLSYVQRFKSYGKKQIFGFHCLYEPLLLNVSQQQRIGLSRPFLVTFETDSQNIDPYVMDCQGVIFGDQRIKLN